MIAVDTNILVAAHRRDHEWHRPAAEKLRELAEGPAPWMIPWPCVHEFLAVVTHPRIFRPPSTLDQALAQVDAWRESPGLVLASEPAGYWDELRECLRAGKVVGPRVHDARVATICACNGVSELWTADRDFSALRGVKAVNPLVG